MGMRNVFTEDIVEGIASILRRNVQLIVGWGTPEFEANRKLFNILYSVVEAIKKYLPMSYDSCGHYLNSLLLAQYDLFLQRQLEKIKYLGFFVKRENALPIDVKYKSLLGVCTDFVVNGYYLPFREYREKDGGYCRNIWGELVGCDPLDYKLWFDMLYLPLANDWNIDEYPDVTYEGFTGKPVLLMSVAGLRGGDGNDEWLKYLAVFPYRIGVGAYSISSCWYYLDNVPDSLVLYKENGDKFSFRILESEYRGVIFDYDPDEKEVDASFMAYTNNCRYDIPKQEFLKQLLEAVENAYPRSKYPDLWEALDRLTVSELSMQLSSATGFLREDLFEDNFTGENNYLDLLEYLHFSIVGGEFAALRLGDFYLGSLKDIENVKGLLGEKLYNSLLHFMNDLGMKIDEGSFFNEILVDLAFGFYHSEYDLPDEYKIVPVLTIYGLMGVEIEGYPVALEMSAVVLPGGEGFWMVHRVGIGESSFWGTDYYMYYSLLSVDKRSFMGFFASKPSKYLDISSLADITGYAVDWSDYRVDEEPSWGEEIELKDHFKLGDDVVLLNDINDIPDCSTANVAYIYNQDENKLGIIVQPGDDDIWFKKWPALTHAVWARSGNISTLISYLHSFKLWPRYKRYFAFLKQYYSRR